MLTWLSTPNMLPALRSVRMGGDIENETSETQCVITLVWLLQNMESLAIDASFYFDGKIPPPRLARDATSSLQHLTFNFQGFEARSELSFFQTLSPYAGSLKSLTLCGRVLNCHPMVAFPTLTALTIDITYNTDMAAVLYGLPQLRAFSLRNVYPECGLLRRDVGEDAVAAHQRTSPLCPLRHLELGTAVGTPILEELELLAELCAPTLRSLRVRLADAATEGIAASEVLRRLPFRKLRRVDIIGGSYGQPVALRPDGP
jgi:hypothetical protein